LHGCLPLAFGGREVVTAPLGVPKHRLGGALRRESDPVTCE
jgi:hypothetical protein